MALLDLKTEGHREQVIIDGEGYLLRAFEGFSITDQHQLQSDGKRITELTQQDEMTDGEVAALEDLSEGLFLKVAGDIPENVRDKLMPGLKQQIAMAYFLELARVQEEKKEEIEATSKNGQEDSPRSADSIQESELKNG